MSSDALHQRRINFYLQMIKVEVWITVWTLSKSVVFKIKSYYTMIYYLLLFIRMSLSSVLAEQHHQIIAIMHKSTHTMCYPLRDFINFVGECLFNNNCVLSSEHCRDNKKVEQTTPKLVLLPHSSCWYWPLTHSSKDLSTVSEEGKHSPNPGKQC